MNNLMNIQKAIVIGLILLGLTSLICGIINEAWHLYFIGIADLILGTLMYNNDGTD